MPSLALQRVRARATPPALRFSLQPLLTTDGLCTAAGWAAYHNTIPMRNHWGYGHPYGVGMRTNMGARLVLAVQSMCNGDDVDTDYQQSQAQPCAHPAATRPEKAGSFPELSNLPTREFEKTFRRFRLLFRPEDLRY